jgi:MOSC domain-containing protein YiiM
MITIHSLQIGTPKTYGDPASSDPFDQPWTTAFFKIPTNTSLAMNELGLEGDGVADPKHHGGIDKAVLAYSLNRYAFWQERLGVSELPMGAFGENLTIDGLDEDSTCLGDRYAIGEAIVEVSQPREPCWKLGRRWRNKMLPKWVAQTGYTGWYFRVIQPGTVQANATLTLLDRPYERWTVARANDCLFGRIVDPVVQAELYLLPCLSEAWKRSLG